jgi:uncharacterized repeat protein (TIGR02543 family)
MKKIIAYCVIFTMVLSMLPLNAFASALSVEADKAALDIGYAEGDSASSVTQDLTLTVTGAVYGSDFTFDPDTGTITGYTGAGGTIEIPSTIGGVPVTAIGDEAFYDNDTITGVIIPEGVFSIGESAFDGCSNIESVTLPDGLTSIERCAFYWCTKLKSIALPDSLTSVGSGMFMGCSKLESVNIPLGITELPESIFSYCESLKSVTIPDNIVSIGGGDFQGCMSLRTVTLPALLTSVGDDAFYNCQQLEQAVFTGNPPTSFGSNVFKDVKDSFRIFYSSDSTGFSSPTWNGYASEQYNPAATYTLTYDANGGATDFPTVDYLYTGDYVIIPNNNDSLVKDGHNFSGWNTSADGTGTAYTEGNVVLIGVENVTLYAQWELRYSISIDTLEHGTITVDKTSAEEGEIFTVTIIPDAGWNYKPNTLKFIDPATGGEIGGVEPPAPSAYTAGKYSMPASDKPTKPPIPDSDIVEDYFMPASDILVTAEFAEGDFLFETITGSGIKITQYIGRGGNVVIPSSIDGKSVTTIGSYTIFYTTLAITGVTIPSTVTTIEEDAISYCSTLESVVFEGNAPTIDVSNFEWVSPDFTIYYYEDSTGFTSPTWKGHPSVAITRTIYTVTFNKNGGETETSPITKTAGSGGNVCTLPTPPTRSGYIFTGWNTAANGSGMAFTAATVVNADLTVYAQWTKESSGGGGRTTTVTLPDTPSVPPATITETPSTGNAPPSVTATTNTEAKADSNGNASATVTENQMTDAINKAIEAAAQKGGDTQAKVEIKVTAPAEAKSVETSIPKAVFTAVADGKTDKLTVSTPIAAITFDNEALSAISKEMTGDVKITASKVDYDSLSEEAKQKVGDRPVFNFSVTSGDKTISQFGGNVDVVVPYTPKAGEDPNSIVIYYINAQGKLETVSNCTYDPATGMISFKTNHFSQYAVGYNKISFKDVAANAWYSNAVSFIASRGITSGTGNGNYSPEQKLTRGEFLVMMMKAYGISPDSNVQDNFLDAGDTYYTNYLAAAKRLGISAGVGNDMFAPSREITRQEMFTLLYNLLNNIGQLPQGDLGKRISDFSDTGEIAPWAENAMTFLVETEIIGGYDGILNPESTTTRAEMAQVLYKLLSK